MNPVSVDIKDVLVAEGIGTFGATSGWAITIGKISDIPNTMIALYDTGGFDQIATFNGGDNLQNPTLDIRVRADNYSTAYAKAEEIDNVLNLIKVSENAILLARDYSGILRQGDIFFISNDDRDRPIFGLNYLVRRYL